MAKKAEKQNSQALTVWNERLAQMAADAAKVESSVGGAGNFLSIKGGILSYQGAQAPENKMRVIIVDAVLENQLYSGGYDPNNPQAPVCYAFGRVADEMVPHEAVESPVAPACKGCPMKEFGSAERGKGKACGDVQRLALIPESDIDNISDAEIAYLKVPYFSTLEYAAYVRLLNETFHRPPMAFVTEITVVPDPKSQFRVKFKMADEINDEAAFEALWKRYQIVSKEIAFPYPKFDDAPAKPAAKGRAATPRVAAPPRPAAPAPARQGPPPKVGVSRPKKAERF